LFGDKTAQSKPSAFDRINVRRLFLVMEKAISTAAKFQLFEFNDEFTRAQFRNLVEPFLRDIQGRRGLTDFAVVCDETNNTAEVIDRNEFIADIFVKPNRSINFIKLNFVATRNAIERWSNGINNHSDNEGLVNPVDYQVDAFVDHLDRNGNTIKSYTFRGMFPTIIGQVDLTMEQATTLETFECTWRYQYWESNTTT
jgi:hypothetical protein